MASVQHSTEIQPAQSALGGFAANTLDPAWLWPLVLLNSASTPDPAFDDARHRLHAGLAEMLAGNPQPGIDLVAEHDDVTLFGAWGPIEKGHESVVDTFRWTHGRSALAVRPAHMVSDACR
jgi:hypothetical protein